MLNILHTNLVISAALVFIVTAHLITRVLKRHKFRRDTQRAIDRLQNLGCREPLEPKPAVEPELSLHVGTAVQTFLNRERPLEPEQEVKPVLLRVGTGVQTYWNHEEPLTVGQEIKPELPLKIGTKVQAVRAFGPVKVGTLGIITGVADVSLFRWSRPTYLCTFAGNIKVHARPKQIEAFDHGHRLDELEQLDFQSILSRRIMWRAQSVLRRRANSFEDSIVRG
jgi:hypothetical protein